MFFIDLIECLFNRTFLGFIDRVRRVGGWGGGRNWKEGGDIYKILDSYWILYLKKTSFSSRLIYRLIFIPAVLYIYIHTYKSIYKKVTWMLRPFAWRLDLETSQPVLLRTEPYLNLLRLGQKQFYSAKKQVVGDHDIKLKTM